MDSTTNDTPTMSPPDLHTIDEIKEMSSQERLLKINEYRQMSARGQQLTEQQTRDVIMLLRVERTARTPGNRGSKKQDSGPTDFLSNV